MIGFVSVRDGFQMKVHEAALDVVFLCEVPWANGT